MSAATDQIRAVADAVLYEGYLLYPYRSTATKNQSRWQFGVLGPDRAAERGLGEDPAITTQLLLEHHPEPSVHIVVRFLQLQRRTAERATGAGFEPVAELPGPSRSWLSWDEAVECELPFGPIAVTEAPQRFSVAVTGGTDIQPVDGGRLVRTRHDLRAELGVHGEHDGDLLRLSLSLRNTGAGVTTKDDAIATSLIGTHLIVQAIDNAFVSLIDPPASAIDAAAHCHQHRCFPVLAGPLDRRDTMLVSPIILYDHPQIAEQSENALYDSTEIDEILTLRIMTMTDEEKAQARATDPLAAEVIDRCDAMSPEEMLTLHGVLRAPHADEPALLPDIPEGVNWWDPLADTAVRPEADAVLVNGVRVARGSRVRLHPSRRADAHDLFYADQIARVTSVHEDVDGERHIGVVLDDDPAADLHDAYGRFLYFAPDEVEPLVDPCAQPTEERSP